MNAPNQITKAPPPPKMVTEVLDVFRTHRKAIEDALPKHVSTDRMMRVALTELRNTPKLMQCDAMSFFGSVVKASQLGLEPGGALGHCYLIPYGREVQLQLGYRGMVDLARRSGNIVSIEARCVYDGDVFEIELGTESKIVHHPKFKSQELAFVYAVAKLKDGGIQFDVMSKGDVEHIRDTYSSGFKNSPRTSPWTTAFDEMAKKTIVRRLFKMLPTSIEIRDAIAIDEDEEQQNAKVIDMNYEVMPAMPDPSKRDALLAGEDAPMAGDIVHTAADRKNAIAELEKAAAGVLKAGGISAEILGLTPEQFALLISGRNNATPNQIIAAADRLSAWEPNK
jgi:recombination protein RecT